MSTQRRPAQRERPRAGGPREPRVAVSDRAGLHVEVTGRGPHAVLLLHGFSDNLSTWRRVVPALAVRHRVIAVDLPGQGRSTRSWQRPLLEHYLGVVDEVLDAHAGEDPVSLVGNSMGAVVAAVYADRHPERVDHVVLIGMPGVGRVPALWRAAASRPASVALRTALTPVPMSRLSSGFGWIYARAASPNPAAIGAEAMRDYAAHYADRRRLFGLAGLARALLAELGPLHLEQLVARLPMPVLQVWGAQDRLVPPRRGESSVVLDGCGHCPQLDAPDRLLAEIEPFLADRPTEHDHPVMYGDEATTSRGDHHARNPSRLE